MSDLRALCSPRLWWLIAVLAIFGLGQRHGFWGNDEPRDAEVAREMYAGGDWVVPRLNGVPILEKPPLAYWAAAAVFRACGGASEERCRVPSALWGLCGALAAGWLGGMLAGGRAGICAAVILATCVEWFYISHLFLVDVPLAGCVALSLALFWRGYSAPGAQRRWYLGCALAAGGAFMAKGAVGIVIPGAAVLAFLFRRREWREIARLAHPRNMAALACLIVPWVLMLWARGDAGSVREFLWVNQMRRFFSPGADHSGGPPWFYLSAMCESLAPWTLFLFPALFALRGDRLEDERSRRSRQFLISLCAAPLLVLSAASGKRQLYFLPLMPGFAIAIAAWLDDDRPGERKRWDLRWRMWGACIFALLSLSGWSYALYAALRQGSGAAMPAAGVVAGALVACAAVSLAVRSGGRSAAAPCCACALSFFFSLLTPPLWSMMEREKGYGPLAAMLDRSVPPGGVLYGYVSSEIERGFVAFQRGAPFPVLRTPVELAKALRSSTLHRVLVNEKNYRHLESAKLLPPHARVVDRCSLSKRDYFLLGGNPGAAETSRARELGGTPFRGGVWRGRKSACRGKDGGKYRGDERWTAGLCRLAVQVARPAVPVAVADVVPR